MDFVRGRQTGLLIPAHGEALRAGGAALLTEAFHAFGSLAPANAVSRITRCLPCPGGSTGQKLLLSVQYQHQEPGLHRDLFVKFSRDFNDPVRDNRGKYEMESEVRLAVLSRLPTFPIHVPVAYFSDYDPESNTGLLITQEIAFGTAGIEPHRRKCLDHELPDPLEHYRTLIRALAHIAAAHRAGQMSPQVETQFPYDAALAQADYAIPYGEDELRALLLEYADFAARCPQLLPPAVVSRSFFERFGREAALYLQHEAAIRRYLQSQPELIALCHWNAQIDNAWFWRDAAGELQCGLMDWGRVSQMNVACAIWGCLSGAPQSIWDRHLDDLLQLFTREFEQRGGPPIDVAQLRRHLWLYVAMMALSYFVRSPSRILSAVPQATSATGPHDPMFRHDDRARNNLHILSVVLSLWRQHDFGVVLQHLLQERVLQGHAPSSSIRVS